MEIPIENILSEYQIEPPDKAVCKQAQAVLADVVGVEVPLEAITYQKGTLRVQAAPLERSQIHIKKAAVLDQLQQRLSNKKISDLR